MLIETHSCPKCPAWMVRRRLPYMLPTNPPQLKTEWWCGCGHTEPAEPVNPHVIVEDAHETWRAANRQREYEERQRVRAGMPWWRRMFG
jgi:hypothetical protein